MTRPAPHRFTVPPTLAGERLDRAMAALAPGVSRGEARRLISAGVVFIAGRRTGICSRLVRAGELISWEAPAPRPVAGSRHEPRVVLERPEFWIVDKPAGMPVEATRAGGQGTVDDWLSRTHGPAFVTHRLDAATSGLVVVARDRPSQAELNRLFAAHAIDRRYLAVVAPAPNWTRTTLDAPLDGQRAVTHAVVVARSPVAAALMVQLETGRTRQIRRHLAQAGCPVVGETAAGVRTHARLLLHAFLLRVPWAGQPGAPAPQAPITASAPPPLDFTAPAEALGLSDLNQLPAESPSDDSIPETDS